MWLVLRGVVADSPCGLLSAVCVPICYICRCAPFPEESRQPSSASRERRVYRVRVRVQRYRVQSEVQCAHNHISLHLSGRGGGATRDGDARLHEHVSHICHGPPVAYSTSPTTLFCTERDFLRRNWEVGVLMAPKPPISARRGRVAHHARQLTKGFPVHSRRRQECR